MFTNTVLALGSSIFDNFNRSSHSESKTLKVCLNHQMSLAVSPHAWCPGVPCHVTYAFDVIHPRWTDRYLWKQMTGLPRALAHFLRGRQSQSSFLPTAYEIWRKVMFLYMSVILSTIRGGWVGVWFGGGCLIYCRGRYASYWNAFLLYKASVTFKETRNIRFIIN